MGAKEKRDQKGEIGSNRGREWKREGKIKNAKYECQQECESRVKTVGEKGEGGFQRRG